jgi:hypothetical protein
MIEKFLIIKLPQMYMTIIIKSYITCLILLFFILKGEEKSGPAREGLHNQLSIAYKSMQDEKPRTKDS